MALRYSLFEPGACIAEIDYELHVYEDVERNQDDQLSDG